MKRLSLIVSFLFLCQGISLGATVKGTPHDLSTFSTTTGPKAVTETQICVFCHTPHGAYSTVTSLWNHRLSSIASYTLPTSPTQLSTPSNPPDGSSKLCLSCHDGTVAIGAVLLADQQTNIIIPMSGTGPGGVMPGTPVPSQHAGMNLGTDLSGTHLISIAVNDQLISDKNAEYASGLTNIQLSYPPAGSPVKLWGTGNLYKGLPGKNGLGVQCSSCHDPHDNTNGMFLVLPVIDETQASLAQQSGTLCGACHPTY